MSGPNEKGQVIVHDPVAHAKLDALNNEVETHGRKLDDLLGVLTSGLGGNRGVLEVQRDQAELLTEHGTRLERHSQRIRAIEEQSGERAKSRLQAIIDRLLNLATMVASGSIGGAIAARFFPHH